MLKYLTDERKTIGRKNI